MITPIWGTYLVLKTLFSTLEGFLGGLLKEHFEFYIPGLGILTLVLLVFFTGLFTTNIIGRKIVELWEFLLNRVPLVRNVYSVFKTVMDTFSFQGKKEFRRVVMIEFPRKGQFSIAFVTKVAEGEAQEVTPQKLVSVYVPTTPNPTSGYLLLVPEEDIIPLSMTVEDGMKMVISGGLYTALSREDQEKVVKGVRP